MSSILTAGPAVNGSGNGTGPALCKHCQRRQANRPRGLCYPCFYTEGVRRLYPVAALGNHRGVGLGTGKAPLPLPTDAPPGTEAKVLVLCDRARRHEQLFHPQDAK
jgi:hypothetical protein